MSQTIGMVRKNITAEDIVEFLKVHWHEDAVLENLDDDPNEKLINFEARDKEFDIIIHENNTEYKEVTNFTDAQTIIFVDEGDYTERKLPCIVKACGKIKIEQKNGEIIEFDEDAVEMLTLIASNRGQREERTVDEKLQEMKYLEGFARAIYNQKCRGIRGRFRDFFAEEILNMSKSQLQRINSLEKLIESVKTAVGEKRLSETAAMEMASMTAEEQEACLEKIITGEIKGTVQDIQNFKSSKEQMEESVPEDFDGNNKVDKEESSIEDIPSESESLT